MENVHVSPTMGAGGGEGGRPGIGTRVFSGIDALIWGLPSQKRLNVESSTGCTELVMELC